MDQITPFFKSPTLLFIFTLWVFLLITLKLIERALYFLQFSRDKEAWKNHSSLCTIVSVLLSFGVLLGALVFVTGVCYIVFM